MRNATTAEQRMLGTIQREAFNYFANETNLSNGLVADTTQPGVPSSIAATGLGLTAYPIGVERGFISRREAVKRTLAALRFFWNSKQGTSADATGYKGFYYHFLDMQTGTRAWNSELSTVDTALLLGGILTAAAYFDGNRAGEREIRDLAERLYERVDWNWARNGGHTVTHGWNPGRGFLRFRWEGYDEAHAAVRPRARRADARHSAGELRLVDDDVRMAHGSRHHVPARGVALRASAFAYVAGLPRYSRRVHGARTIATTSRTAVGRRWCSSDTPCSIQRLRALRRVLLGHHRERRARPSARKLSTA